MKNNEQIGKRLSEEIEQKFGSLKGAALAIGVASGAYFRPYIAGTSKPGMTLRNKLKKAGVDVDYVMTGKRISVPSVKSDEQNELKKSIEDIQSQIVHINDELTELLALVNKK